jgi:hypothetical protein
MYWQNRFKNDLCIYCGKDGVSKIYKNYSCHNSCENNANRFFLWSSKAKFYFIKHYDFWKKHNNKIVNLYFYILGLWYNRKMLILNKKK